MRNLKCAVCDGTAFTQYLQVYNLSHLYTLMRCVQCHFVFVHPSPPTEFLSTLYNEQYFQNPAFNMQDNNNYCGYDIYLKDRKNIQDKFSRCLNLISTYKDRGKLLDVGCAAGFFLEMAARRGYDTTGVDISDYACRQAIELFKLNVFHNNLRSVRFRDASFDIVTLWDVIEHLPDPQADICEINRVLAPGGILGIITPDIEAFIPRVLGKRWLELKRVPEHLVFFGRSTLSLFLDRAGFEILTITTIGKKFYLSSLIKNLSFQNSTLRTLARAISPVHMPSWTIPFPINPFYKMLVIAHKVRNVPGGHFLSLSQTTNSRTVDQHPGDNR